MQDVLIDVRGHGPVEDDKFEKLAHSFEKFVSDCEKAGLPIWIGTAPAPRTDAPEESDAKKSDEPKKLFARPGDVKAEKPEEEKPAPEKPAEPEKPAPTPSHAAVRGVVHGTTH